MKTSKLTLTALLSAVALIFGYIESLFPIPVPIPGIKLGLGNIVVLTALYCIDTKTAVFVMLIKVFASTLLFSAPSTILYSLSGGIVSVTVMYIMKKFKFNMLCTSMGGGISHNIAQLCCAALTVGNINILYYLPVLIISGGIVALAVGYASKIVCKNISALL